MELLHCQVPLLWMPNRLESCIDAILCATIPTLQNDGRTFLGPRAPCANCIGTFDNRTQVKLSVRKQRAAQSTALALFGGVDAMSRSIYAIPNTRSIQPSHHDMILYFEHARLFG